MNDMRVPTRHLQHRDSSVEAQQSNVHHVVTPKRHFPVVPIVVAIITFVAFAGLIYFFTSKTQAINTNGYQVVYLTTGQAYFGKLKNTTGEYLVIDTPYIAQDVKSAADTANNTPQSTLMKVSNQLYGPTDSIAIRANQVSFWQNLRDDSKVVQAIKNKQ